MNELTTINSALVSRCKAFVDDSGLIGIKDPFEDGVVHMNVNDYIASARKFCTDLRDDFEKMSEVDRRDIKKVRAMLNRAKSADDALRIALSNVSEDFLTLTGLDAAETQFAKKVGRVFSPASLRGIVRGIKDACNDMIEAVTPAAPARSFVIRIDATDKQFAKVADAATKAGCPFSAFATPQSDKAVKQIAKWFEENV